MSGTWPELPLAEILIPRQDKPSEEDLLSGKVRIVAKIPFGSGRIEFRPDGKTSTGMILVHPGDLLVSGINAYKGAIAIYDPEAKQPTAATIHYSAYAVISDRAEARFLWYLLRSDVFRDNLERVVPGGIKTELKAARFLQVPIPLPPLPEQRRIVGRIDGLAAKIDEARGLRQQAVEEAERLLASASAAAFKPRSGWTEAPVGDFCEHPQYGYTASATPEKIGPRFLRITDIQNGLVKWDNVPFCQCPNPEQYLLQNNDLVFARTGATTGKSFVIRDCPKAVFASYLIRLRVQRLVTVEYLYRYFQTPSYWSQIIDEKKGTGQPNVNGKKLASIRVPIAPSEEQHRIVAHLDNLQAKVDAVKRLQAETAAELDALLPSILDKAFRGEL